jgi:2-deoxy-D-gluconate 3-dehydrogenase
MPNDLFSLDGQVALVTGASRGLGQAIAIALSNAGADIVLHSNSTPADATARKIAETSGERTKVVTADLTSSAAASGLVAEAHAAFGRLDIVVNNAGTIRRKPAAEHDDDFWDEVIAVNLSSVFRVCRAAGKHFLAAGQPGKIINIASLLAFQGGVTVPGYAAAKGGVVQLTKALANEWAASGINVNAIAPGYMETDNTTALRADATRFRQISERIPAGRWGKPEDLGGAAVFLASRASDYVHGHVLVVDGGWMGR